MPIANFGERLAFLEDRLLVSRSYPTKKEPPRWFERRGQDFKAAGALTPPRHVGSKDLDVEHFGSALAVHKNQLLVAAQGTYAVPGTVFLFRTDNGDLPLENQFTYVIEPGIHADFMNFYMGVEIAFDDEHTALATSTGSEPDLVITFRKKNDQWRYEQTIQAHPSRVAVLNSRMLVGSYPAPGHSVAVYLHDGNRWKLTDKLPAAVGVALDVDRAVLSNGRIFRWNGTKFEEEQKLLKTNGKQFSGMGPVLLDNGIIVIGEPNEDSKGSVYVFETSN